MLMLRIKIREDNTVVSCGIKVFIINKGMKNKKFLSNYKFDNSCGEK